MAIEIYRDNDRLYKRENGMVYLVGKIKGRTYFINRSPHDYLIVFKGFGISRDIIKYMVANKITIIKMIYHSSKLGAIRYKCSLSDFLDENKREEFEVHGDLHYILPITEWHKGWIK